VYNRRGGTSENCGYATLNQCRAQVWGLGGWCRPNPFPGTAFGTSRTWSAGPPPQRRGGYQTAGRTAAIDAYQSAPGLRRLLPLHVERDGNVVDSLARLDHVLRGLGILLEVRRLQMRLERVGIVVDFE